MQLSYPSAMLRAPVAYWRSLRPSNGKSNRSRPELAVQNGVAKPNGCLLEASGYSDVGCVRRKNEDYFRIEPQLGFYALADGMGGAEGGAYASRLAVDTVAERVVSAENRDSQVLLSAVEEANRRVVEAARGAPDLQGMGTTLLAGLALGDNIHITSVGDSRVYLLDDTGLHPITQDQSWMHEVGRFLGLDDASLRKHPMRNMLTMAIGHGTPLKVNNYSVRLKPPTMLLMCTDGLHGVVEQPKIEQILRDTSDDSLETKCRSLVDAARAAGGPDNISVVLLRSKSHGLWSNALRSWRRTTSFDRTMLFSAALMAAGVFYAPTIAEQVPALGSRLMSAAAARATVDLADDFHAGFDAWNGKPGWENTWSIDSSGWVKPGRLALFTDTVPLSNYRAEFMGQIQSKGLGFVFRAADTNNYYAARLVIVKPGPLPTVALVRYAVVDGREGPSTQVPVPLALHNDTYYRVVAKVRGDHLSVSVNGQLADAWSDDRLKTGGIGFFADHGEVFRVRGVRVVDKDDFLGRALQFGQSISNQE